MNLKKPKSTGLGPKLSFEYINPNDLILFSFSAPSSFFSNPAAPLSHVCSMVSLPLIPLITKHFPHQSNREGRKKL